MIVDLKSKLKLEDIVSEPNLVSKVHEDDLQAIYQDVMAGYQADKDSRIKWEHETAEVVKLANMDRETKNTPWENASNVKLPIISICVAQFAARTYPEIVHDGQVAGVYVTGPDADGTITEKARRTTDKMNSQLLVESNDWETSFDKLTHAVPLVGHSFKKVYYDPVQLKIVSELVPYTDVAIHQDVESLEKAPRVTHLIRRSKNQLLEMLRMDLYSISNEDLLDIPNSATSGDDRHELLEQHRYLDLDGDGYEEPYIVTVLKDHSEVLRIVARFGPRDVRFNDDDDIIAINPVQYFVDYICMHNPDGTYWGIGLGHLLYDLTKSANTLHNQLVDAGTLANTTTGFADRAIRIKGGDYRMEMGRINKVDSMVMGSLKDHFHMLDFKEPSGTLFQLLQLTLQNAKELASITEANMGNAQVQNVASSVMSSQLSEGSKLLTGIQRRMYRGLKKEFEAYFRLNSLFLDMEQYAQQCQMPLEVVQDDWNPYAVDIRPVADPSMGNEATRMQRSESLLKLYAQPVFTDLMNGHATLRSALEALRLPNVEEILPPPNPEAPPPPEVIKLQSEIAAQQSKDQLAVKELELRALDMQIKEGLSQAEITKMLSEAHLNTAKIAQLQKDTEVKELAVHKDAMIAGMNNEAKIQSAKIAADAKKQSGGKKDGGTSN